MDRAVSHYLDGITVKIGEKYRPPRRITLPPGLCQVEPSDIFAEDYDCVLEEAALQLTSQIRRRQQEVLERRREVIEAEKKIKQEAQSIKLEEEKLEATVTVRDETVVEETVVTSFPTVNGPSPLFNTFLQPTKTSFVTNTKEQEKPCEPLRNFNLEDFEGYSTPFEEMELKTLNDKAELALVLQPTMPVESQKTLVQPYPTPYTSASWHCSPYPPVQYAPVASWMPYPPASQQYALNQDFSRNPFVTDLNVTSKNPTLLRQAKSVPDLSDMGAQQNNATANFGTQETLRQFTVGPEKRLSSRTPPPRLLSSNPKPVVKPTVVPSLDLDAEEKRLLTQLSDMGFPNDRIVHALHRYGRDEKQVLDFLLLVQNWEEKGYPPKVVESAITQLNSSNNSTDAATLEKHLMLHGQLSALGFSEDRISAALISAEHDRDKAIDILLSY